MKKMIIFICLGVLLGAGVILFMVKRSPTSACPESLGTTTIRLKMEEYAPMNIQIKRCTTVTFQNTDSTSHWPASDIHPTHGIYPEFDPKTGIPPGKSWQFTFDKVGTWRYHDHLFPLIHGTIAVTE